jgi:hypothetical protein
MLCLNSPHWIISASIVTVPSILLCLLGLWVVRKWISHKAMQENHDVAGFTLGIIGVLYSVVLGFTVVNVQTRYNEAIQIAHAEAFSIADLYRESTFFPDPARSSIQSALRNYIQFVVEKEWGKKTDPALQQEAHQKLAQIWDGYYQVDLQEDKTKIWYQESIGKLDTFMNARLTRQFSAWEHLSPMMWSILLIGGVITVCFMYFFGLEKIEIQMLMVALLSGYISLMLFLVYSLNNIYLGPEAIQPTAFEEVVQLFDHWDRSKG